MQKTLLGYNYKQIKKKLKACDLIGGGVGLFLCLRVPGKAYTREYRVVEETDTYLMLSSGNCLYQIIKGDKK